MKCPYSDCRKDYNDSLWDNVAEDWINPNDYNASFAQRTSDDRIFLISRRCRFCQRLFHEIFIGKEKFDKEIGWGEPILNPLISYPQSKTKFESKKVPKIVVDAFNEAERCRSVGSLTGTGGCLRKTIYTLCDEIGVEGEDYRKKISNIPVKDIDKELLTQIKWLGDNITKPGEEKYTMEMVDAALEILPVIIDNLYIQDEKTEDIAKLLAKARSANASDK